MAHKGRVRNGVVVLDQPAASPEGTAVLVEPLGDREALQSLREGLLRFAGTMEDMPPDMARNHDHYLYGTPKK